MSRPGTIELSKSRTGPGPSKFPKSQTNSDRSGSLWIPDSEWACQSIMVVHLFLNDYAYRLLLSACSFGIKVQKFTCGHSRMFLEPQSTQLTLVKTF